LRHLPLLIGLAACGADAPERDPALVLSETEVIDFGQVRVGVALTGGYSLRNEGSAPLLIEGAWLEAGDAFSLAQPPVSVPAGLTDVLTLSFTPADPGVEEGELVLVTNEQPGGREVRLPIRGEGIEPSVDVDPAALSFDGVAPGRARTMSLQVFSDGHGALEVTDVSVYGADGLFTVDLLGEDLPWLLEEGTGERLEVTFAPFEEGSWSADLLILSDDQDGAELVVSLAGTTYVEDDDDAPTAEITAPAEGSEHTVGEPLALEGRVEDDLDLPVNLLAAWYVTLADGERQALGDSAVEHDGRTELLHDLNWIAGEVGVELEVTDSEGQTGSDSVQIMVR